MAIKYPENTSYDISSVSKTLPSLIKAAQQRATSLLQGKSASPAGSIMRVGESSPVAGVTSSSESPAAPYVNSGVTVSPSFPTGTTVKQYEAVTGKPYSFETPSTSYEIKGKYLNPSEVTPAAKFQSLSEYLGGGQYIIEPTKPSSPVQSTRTTDWKTNELIRQGLDPSLYEIDHKIPLWAGGSDTAANKEILDKVEHATKTKIQAIPLTLLANGLISQREAMNMAINWKDKSETWDIRYPEPGNNGLISLKDAERISNKWNETPSVTWKSFFKELPAAGEKIYQAGAKVVDAILPKSKATAAPREFIKGFVGAIPGYNVAMPQLDVYADYNNKAANTTGNVSHVLGSITGNLITFGWAYKLALKGLAKAGVKWAAKEIGQEVGETAAKELTKDVIERQITRESIPELLGTVAKAKALTSPSLGAEVFWSGGKLSSAAPKLTKAAIYTANVLPKAATLGVVSSALGQLRPMNSQDRVERAALDFAYGFFSPVGRAAYTVKGYAKVAAPALTISLMEGLNPSNSFANAMTSALINTGTMIGMHGVGQVGQAFSAAGKPLSGILTSPQQGTVKEYQIKQTSALRQAEQNFSNKWREVKFGELNSELKTGILKSTDLGITSKRDLQYQKSLKPSELDKQNAILNKYIHWKAEQEGWHPETTARETLKIFTSGRALYKGGLTTTARTKADLEDMVTYSQRMRDPNPDLLTVPRRIKNLANNISPEELKTPPDISSTILNESSDFLNAKFLVTGENMGDNPEKMSRIIKAIKTGDVSATELKDGKYLVNGVLSLEPHLKFPAREGVNPDDSIRVYLPNDKHGLEDIGFIATKERIEGRENSFNYNRAKSLGIDPTKITLTPELRVKTGMADPDINNGRLADEMRKNDTVALKVSLLIDPEVASAKLKGENKSFLMAFVNDDAWDNPSLKKIVDLMTKETGLTPRQAEVATENVAKSLKERPASHSQPVATEPPISPSVTVTPTIIERQPPSFLSPEKKETVTPGLKTSEEELDEFITWLNRDRQNKTGSQPQVMRTLSTALAEKPKNITEPITGESPRIMEENPNARITTLAESIAESKDNVNNSFPEALLRNLDTKTNNQILNETGTESWGTYNNEKINKGVASYIDKSLEKLSPNTIEYSNLSSLKNDFSKDTVTIKAKEIFSKNNGNEEKSLLEFKNDFSKKFKDNGLMNPLEQPKIDRFVTKLFRDAAYSSPKKVLTIVDGKWTVEQRSPINRSSLVTQLEKYNAENGTDIDILHFEVPKNNRKINDFNGDLISKEDINLDSIYQEMIKRGYLPLGVSGNNLGTLYAVKYNKKLGSNANEFITNLFTKVMGFPTGTPADVINKRSKLFNDYNLPNPVQGETYTHHIISTDKTTLKALGYTEADFSKSIKNGLATEESVRAILKKNIFDGKIFITQKMMNKILEKGGYVGERKRLKPTMDYSSPSGEKILQKGDLSVLDETHTKIFEDIIRKQPGMENFKISDNDVITFPDNVKVGLKDETAKYATFQAPSETFRFQYSYEPEIKASFSISTWAKFLNKDELNVVVKDLYKPHIDEYKTFIKELNQSKTPAEGAGVLKKYEKYGKDNFGEDLYGTVKKMVSNGAWHKSIGNTIDSMVNKVFQEKIISGSFIKGNHLTLTPDFGVKNGKFLSANEVMISRKAWEAMDKPEYVLTKRYPATRSTAMTKSKVFIAEDYGIKNLGMEQIIPSHFDTYVRKEGDFDADSFHVFKIGGKDGIPEKVANKIEKIRSEEGDMVMDPLDKFDKTPLTFEGLKNISEKALQGGKAVGQVATMVRTLPFLAESGFKVGNMEPVWDSKTAKYLSQLSQFSTDAVKSPSLYNEMKKEGVEDISDLIIKKVFTNVNNNADIKKIKTAIFNAKVQIPFEIANKDQVLNSNRELASLIKDYNKRVSNKTGGPVKDLMALLDDLEPYKYDFRRMYTPDIKAAETAVKEAFSGEYKATANVNEFQSFFKRQYADFLKKPIEEQNSIKKDFKQSLIDRYRENEVKYTPEEKRSIHIWLASDPNANLATKKRDASGGVLKWAKDSAWSNKLDEVFNDSPDIAKIYYKAFEEYGINLDNLPGVLEAVNPRLNPPAKKDGKGGPADFSSKYNNLKNPYISKSYIPLGQIKDPYSDPKFKQAIVNAESKNMDDNSFKQYLAKTNPDRLKYETSPNKYQNAGQYGWKVGFTEGTYNEIIKAANRESAIEKEGGKALSRYRNLLKTLDFSTPEKAVDSAVNYIKFRNIIWDKNGKPSGTYYDPKDFENMYLERYNSTTGPAKDQARSNWRNSLSQINP